ncbi:MAG: 4-alpha-glucanotransferase [Hyphomicrobiaceae bacterium]|nr:4-alpha-glucanotransferase [Hyphomicrobiaceae bacterium]
MNEGLYRLADAHGIEHTYISESGEQRIIADGTKRLLLSAMLRTSVPDIVALEDKYESVSPMSVPPQGSGAEICFLPPWLRDERAWGLTVQLYGVRSERNHGIGDFEDLARLAEMAAGHGADFIGLNPLHILFWSEPARCSPYAPSTRQFLNPNYIALDRVPGSNLVLAGLHPGTMESLRHSPMVDYVAVAGLKRRVLERIYQQQSPEFDPAFVAFRREQGDDLQRFALFEAISDAMAQRGLGSGWHNWPSEYQDSRSLAVSQFAAEHAGEIVWHQWVQWIASQQLAEAQRRARAAGMRIGLYLDLAVGVAPDGAATWADPELVTTQAKVGAPPDIFNELGQDWGLAPMTPSTLIDRDLKPFARDVTAAMAAAGAIRIDHAMGLQRLFWIPKGLDARGGGFVRYPFGRMLDSLAELSARYRSMVIGEDLGTVPVGFRDVMRERGLLSYRVFYFERHPDGSFFEAEAFPREAFACVGTHDLPTLRGWWWSTDVTARKTLGFASDAFAEEAYRERQRNRSHMLALLANAGLLNDQLRTTAQNGGEVPNDLPDDVFVALHVHMARTPCRLFGVQLEDLSGAVDQVNLPGTHMEYPNWCRKLPITLEEFPGFSLFAQTIKAVARERPKAAA